MSNGFKRKVVKCGECGEPKLLLYNKESEEVQFVCKCGAINKYEKGTKAVGTVIEEV